MPICRHHLSRRGALRSISLPCVTHEDVPCRAWATSTPVRPGAAAWRLGSAHPGRAGSFEPKLGRVVRSFPYGPKPVLRTSCRSPLCPALQRLPLRKACLSLLLNSGHWSFSLLGQKPESWGLLGTDQAAGRGPGPGGQGMGAGPSAPVPRRVAGCGRWSRRQHTYLGLHSAASYRNPTAAA